MWVLPLPERGEGSVPPLARLSPLSPNHLPTSVQLPHQRPLAVLPLALPSSSHTASVAALRRSFRINDPFMHDLSVDIFAERTVWTKGFGTDMNIDCHRGGARRSRGVGRRRRCCCAGALLLPACCRCRPRRHPPLDVSAYHSPCCLPGPDRCPALFAPSPSLPQPPPPGWHEFAEFTAEDVGTVDSGLNSMARCG